MMIDTTYIESLIEKHDPPVKANSKGDKINIFLLLLLYTLQGVPMGFSLAIPMIMQNKWPSSYKEQAKFSFAIWPFSLKLLWAPLVDSLFIRKLGRRKSWLIPLQYFLGIFFFITGFNINEWLVCANKPQINSITLMFFILNFLAATQDIVVDGWALTMLNKKNISYSAMCNSAGQAFGIFLGNILLIMLTSESFWNKWWRTSPLPDGLITLQGYFYVWGTIYIIITTLVALLKHEQDFLSESDITIDFAIIKMYKLLFSIMQLPNIKKFAIILLTVKISFSSVDCAYKLKLIDGGVTKDEIAIIELLFIPLRISLPFFITKFTSKEKPLNNYFNTIPYRLLVGIVFTIVIYFTPYFLIQGKPLIIAYKVVLVWIYFLQQIMVSIMMVTVMGFYANISDPKIGGTNMTLLTTIGNIGLVWSNSGALWLIDFLTFKRCSKVDDALQCSSKTCQNVSNSSGEICQVIIDGFYIETLICTIYGIIWYCVFRKSIKNLQSKNSKEWHIEIKMKERL